MFFWVLMVKKRNYYRRSFLVSCLYPPSNGLCYKRLSKQKISGTIRHKFSAILGYRIVSGQKFQVQGQENTSQKYDAMRMNMVRLVKLWGLDDYTTDVENFLMAHFSENSIIGKCIWCKALWISYQDQERYFILWWTSEIIQHNFGSELLHIMLNWLHNASKCRHHTNTYS